ncbi:MAG: pknB 3 [Nocardioidaceae bacterium]|nr:pknB 3 [Nocardioidaceae bacterium]
MTVGPAERYRLDEVLGQGGAARVHRAHDTVLGRDVAVKVLLEVSMRGSSATGESAGIARARFVTEARTVASLNHPHLVALLDAGFDGEHPFLVMQLVDGPTLAALVAATPGGTDARRVATIGSQVADALAYTHARGVVHRDVKPANILVADPHGPDIRAALADFGIARLLTIDEDATRHTVTGLAIGTAAYLAPEQVRGETVTPAADVYALGLVLLEALTGRRTYPGPPIEAAVARLSSSPDIPGHLGMDWRDLLAAMTRTEPTGRPTAAEVKAQLDALSRSRSVPPTTSLPITAATPLPSSAISAKPLPVAAAGNHGRSRPWLTLAAAAVLLVAGIGATQLGGTDSGSSPAPVSETPDHPATSDTANVAVASSSPSATPSGAQQAPAVTTSKGPPKHPRKPKKVKAHGTHGKKGR